MRPSIFSTACALVVFVSSSSALRAVPQQQCASVCGNVTSTKASDIVCDDAQFTNTPQGQVFRNCLNCQINSTAGDRNTGESDLRWALYNMRFALSMCMFGYPDNSSVLSSPCVTNSACDPYQPSLQFDSLSPQVAPFDYCVGVKGIKGASQSMCTACLKYQSANYYLSNFFTALLAACQQEPAVGSTLSLAGNLFSTNPVTITTPTPTGAATYVPSSSNANIGNIVGVTLTGVFFVLVILGFCIVCVGKRRRRAHLRRLAERDGLQVSEYSQHQPLAEPKWGQRGLTSTGGWSQDESPATMGEWESESSFQAFSPYSSRYSSPVSARDALNPKQTWEWPGMRAPTPSAKPASTTPPPLGERNFSPSSSPSERDAQGPVLDRDGLETIELGGVRNAAGQGQGPRQGPERKGAEERQTREQEQAHKRFLAEAVQRGFTTSPILRVPERAGKLRGR